MNNIDVVIQCGPSTGG